MECIILGNVRCMILACKAAEEIKIRVLFVASSFWYVSYLLSLREHEEATLELAKTNFPRCCKNRRVHNCLVPSQRRDTTLIETKQDNNVEYIHLAPGG